VPPGAGEKRRGLNKRERATLMSATCSILSPTTDIEDGKGQPHSDVVLQRLFLKMRLLSLLDG
jgi:hypothetical protein